jgi:hypothetical protein
MNVKIQFLLFYLLAWSPISFSQESNFDTINRFGLHIGVNYGGGITGGNVGGGLLKVSPRIGVNFKERFVFGIESNSDFQIVYPKDFSTVPSLRHIKWVGPYVRYYFNSPEKKWNYHTSLNYILGTAYVSSLNENFTKSINTTFLGLGISYKYKKTLFEAGYRYTFLMNNTPVIVRWTNSIFLGLSWNL